MATIQFKRGDEYLLKISKLEAGSKELVIGPAVYGAAGIVADAIAAELKKVPTDKRWGTETQKKDGPKKEDLEAIQNGLGIAKMQDEGGYYNVKIGFDGYSATKTKKYPKGQPVQMLARSVERGTSFMAATPFVKMAVTATRKAAVEKIKTVVDEKIKATMEGDQ